MLNPTLYNILRRRFGDVVVQSEGALYRFKVENDSRYGATPITLDAGEQYCVNCPVCGDTRHRLNIGYVFGEPLRHKGLTLRAWGVAQCWNEECAVVPMLKQLVSEAQEHGEVAVQVHEGPIDFEMLVKHSAELHKKLTGLVKLHVLNDKHPAIMYIRQRGYDPSVLEREYDVRYCESYDPFCAAHRLVIPIFYGGICVGWQARAIPGHSPSQHPKYFTSPGCRLGSFLYNFDNAKKWTGVVVTEGPTKAWRVGGCGVATLGRFISPMKRRHIYEVWGRRTDRTAIVLVSDPGFEEDWKNNLADLQKELAEPDRAFLYSPDRDVGDIPTEQIWEVIHAECAKRNLRVPSLA